MKKPQPRAVRIPLTPYPGNVYVVADRESYAALYTAMFGGDAGVSVDEAGAQSFLGMTAWATDVDDSWDFLVWADAPASLAHEMGHVCVVTARRVGFSPSDSDGEPFCYLLGHLVGEAWEWVEKQVKASKSKAKKSAKKS